MLKPILDFIKLYSIQTITMVFFLISGTINLCFPLLTYRLGLFFRKGALPPTKKKVLFTRLGGLFSLILFTGLMLNYRPSFRLASSLGRVEHKGASGKQRGALIEGILTDFLESNYIPAAAVAIISDGEISYHTVDSKLDAVYEIGSLSKVFTGIMLAKALEDEVVTLDEPLNSYLPRQLNGKNSFFEQVNLKQLTTHTSGFPRQPLILSKFPPMLLRGYLARNPYKIYSDEAIYENMLKLKPIGEPGKSFAYSNYGVGLLGHLLTLRYGKESYEELCKEMICTPLELNDTTVTLSANQEWRFASGYSAYFPLGPLRVGIQSKPWEFPETLAAAGSLRSTILDMSRFLQANMEVYDSIYATSHQPLYPIDEHMAIGMGWITSQEDELSSPFIWHNGQTGGFTSFIGFTSDRRHGIVILTNGFKRVDKLAISLLSELDK